MGAEPDLSAADTAGGEAEPATSKRAGLVPLVAVGLVVGAVLGLALGWEASTDGADHGDDQSVSAAVPSTGAPGASAEAAAELVAAYERSRRATYSAVSELVRTTAAGESVRMELVVVQRPPDRVSAGGGSVQAIVGSVRRTCDEVDDELTRCQDLPYTQDYEATVRSDLEALRSNVEGSLPAYSVTRSGDCFDLRLTRAVHFPPYGRRARFCFDAETGAPSSIRVERSEATDVVTLIRVTGVVTDADLAAAAERYLR